MKIEIKLKYGLWLVFFFIVIGISSCSHIKTKNVITYKFLGDSINSPFVLTGQPPLYVHSLDNPSKDKIVSVIYFVDITCDSTQVKKFESSNSDYINKKVIFGVDGQLYQGDFFEKPFRLNFGVLPEGIDPRNNHTVELIFMKKDSTIEKFKYEHTNLSTPD